MNEENVEDDVFFSMEIDGYGVCNLYIFIGKSWYPCLTSNEEKKRLVQTSTVVS